MHLLADKHNGYISRAVMTTINPDAAGKLFSASYKEAGREEFVGVLRTIPLNKANFEVVYDNAISPIARRWVGEYWGPELMQILSQSQGWDDWVMDFPLIDELVLCTTSDPRWLEVLAFRWTMSDGRPEDGPRHAPRTNDERRDFFSKCWKMAIAEDNVERVEQMLQHPQWVRHLNQDIIQTALWRPLNMWRVFHNNNQTLPLRMFWQGVMAGGHSLNHEKMRFLICEMNSAPDFIVQQYAHCWRQSLPENLAQLIQDVANNTCVDTNVLNKLHQNIADALLRNTLTKTGEGIEEAFDHIPLFDGAHLISAIAQECKTPLDDDHSAVVERVLQNLDCQTYDRIVAQYADHLIFQHVPSMQQVRIERTLSPKDNTRSKKI